MVTTALSAPCTIEDLAYFPDDGKLREIVDGQMVEWDVTNIDHGFFAGVLTCSPACPCAYRIYSMNWLRSTR